jgi:ABC-2 type transport system ATP-binding protein
MISRIGEGRSVILSTHQTEDVAALCSTVAVIHGGRTLFHGTPARLIEQAAGRVWLGDARSPDARLSWRTGTGQHRNIGDIPPAGAELVPPTIEDAYLLLIGDESAVVAA